ncbi:MAG: phosphotransferase, partial [Glaciihabitans sp.]
GLADDLAASPADIAIEEVTAGNMNRVFLARGPLGSVAVKQAPPWVQVAGPDWPIDPARIASEARAYELLAELVPESVPVIESVDLDRFVLVMEDLSDLRVLRDVLVAEVDAVILGQLGDVSDERVAEAADAAHPAPLDFEALGVVVGRFVAELSLATSVVTLSPGEHAELVASAANPTLCALTDAMILDEPYREHEHNHWLPELDAAVAAMHADEELAAAAAVLRETFASRAEALIHGDLHTGSVMVGTRDGEQVAKIFDPEFGFVGPIGMDLGLFWANITMSAIAARAVGAEALAAERERAIPASWTEFRRVVTERWADRVASPDDLSLDDWLARIHADSWGFAGAESMRRVAGYAHAADIDSLPNDAAVAAHSELIRRARGWIVDRTDPATAA